MATKSNARMLARTGKNLSAMEREIETWDSPYRARAERFMHEEGSENLFEALHSMRRWYSGGSMAYCLFKQRELLSQVMALSPKDALGVYRGFKVDRGSDLADLEDGDRLSLGVTRNGGFSAWSTSFDATQKFSGAGKGKVGIIVRLVSTRGVTPVLAPMTHTEDWFNDLYAHVIGNSWRPTESEYLLQGSEASVEVERMKR